MCAIRLFGCRLRWVDRLSVNLRTVTSSPMYSTSFDPTRTLLGAFVAGRIGFGEADAVSAGSGFPGNGFEMDDRCSMALAFAAGNAEDPTILAGWNGL
jgi:hypothetical protein